MLALSITLFSGILLKTDQSDENMYGQALLAFMLVANPNPNPFNPHPNPKP
jgi:hypothetical protein